MLEQTTEMNMLLDFYAQLLTDKQRYALEMYYSEDLSLAEIAENISISRQGVHDLLRRSAKLLKDYEKKLGLVAKFERRKHIVTEIIEILDSQHNSNDHQVLQLLQKIDEQEE